MGIPRILRQITQHHESISYIYIYIYRVNKTKKNMWKAKGFAFGTTFLVCFPHLLDSFDMFTGR